MRIRQTGVYSIACAATGKVYIGSSRDIHGRRLSHLGQLARGKHPVPELQSDWNKYGLMYFFFSVLELCSREQQFEREQWNLDLTPEAIRYNLSPTAGTIKDYKRSDANKEKSSRAHRLLTDEQVAEAEKLYRAGQTCATIGQRFGVGLWVIHKAVRGKLLTGSSEPVVGVVRRKRTPEMRARMSKAGKSRAPMSIEAREKISTAMKGREFSDEWLAKISAANRGKTRTPEQRVAMSVARKAAYAVNPELRIKAGNARRGKALTPEMRLKHIEVFQSPELRAKMSAAHKGKPWTEAQRAARQDRSPEVQAKISANMKAAQGSRSSEWREKQRLAKVGKSLSLETRAKLSAALIGRKRSPETCRKLSEANIGKHPSEEEIGRAHV